MTTDAAHDRALATAGDEWEDALHELALLDHLLLYGEGPNDGPAYWFRLADWYKLKNGGRDEQERTD